VCAGGAVSAGSSLRVFVGGGTFFFVYCVSLLVEVLFLQSPLLVTLCRTFTLALIFEDMAKFLGGWAAASSARTPKVGVTADPNIDALHLPGLDIPNLRKVGTKRAPADCPEDRTIPSALPRASLRSALGAGLFPATCPYIRSLVPLQ
jgi:hypothetical protein